MATLSVQPGTITGTARADLIVDLTDLAIWLTTHPDAEAPDSPVINKRVRGETYPDKLADLHRIAASWDTDVTTLPDGTLIAERVFGKVTYEAHLAPFDRTLNDYFTRTARARRAQRTTRRTAA
jgi:hypothetical protein